MSERIPNVLVKAKDYVLAFIEWFGSGKFIATVSMLLIALILRLILKKLQSKDLEPELTREELDEINYQKRISQQNKDIMQEMDHETETMYQEQESEPK